jgi:branched-chain amino acid transport system permease protein/neutral amino acid transport system permease protein
MLQLVANGVVFGCIIALGAIGLTLIYGILRFGNFAHGDTMSLGAYLVLLFLGFEIPFLAAVGGAIVVSIAVAVLIDRYLYTYIRRAGPIILLIASVGVALFLRNVILLIWGPDLDYYTRDIQFAVDILPGVRLKPYEIFIVLAAAVLIFMVHLFLKKSKMGKAMRACADDLDLAEVVGIDTRRVVFWTWVVGMTLAVSGGTMLGVGNGLRPSMGWELLLPLFAAAILGGIGKPYGAMAGGLVIGIAQEVSAGYMSTAYKPAVAFAIMIIVLLVRPQGIFGGRQRWV